MRRAFAIWRKQAQPSEILALARDRSRCSPVRQQIIYKTVVLVWKGIYTMQPLAIYYTWLTCVCRPSPCVVASNCVPRTAFEAYLEGRGSTASGTLLVTRARTATGQRSFAVNYRPRTWNSLPADLRTPDTTLYAPSSVISRPTCFRSSLCCC